jgi:hypothetical protein
MNEVDKNVASYAANLPADERNPHAEETFDQLIERAEQPAPSKSEKQAPRDGYTQK